MTDHPTRRKMLAALATAAAGASVAVPVAFAASAVDAGLFALERELRAAHARMEEALKLVHGTADQYSAQKPAEPTRPAPPKECADLYDGMTGDEYALLETIKPEHPIVLWHRATVKPYRAAWKAYGEACDRLSRETGYDAAETAFNACVDERHDLAERIFATRATTLAGMGVKLRVYDLLAMWEDPENGGFDSLAADVEAMLEAVA